MKDAKRVVDKRHEAIKNIQEYYIKKWAFNNNFESNWYAHLDGFLAYVHFETYQMTIRKRYFVLHLHVNLPQNNSIILWYQRQ